MANVPAYLGRTLDYEDQDHRFRNLPFKCRPSHTPLDFSKITAAQAMAIHVTLIFNNKGSEIKVIKSFDSYYTTLVQDVPLKGFHQHITSRSKYNEIPDPYGNPNYGALSSL